SARSKERRLAEPNKRRATPQYGRQGTFPRLKKIHSKGWPPEGPIAASCSLRIRPVFAASHSLRSALLAASASPLLA
ncbi:hypothetical protein, partial [Burkholderia ubonensis]|uniref:hypothetical protein n=1 Tax=Burkholderia ubonensis TaxID=101571 RepID=UPI001E5915EB